MLPHLAAHTRCPPLELRTPRLVLKAPDRRLAEQVVAFHARNLQHFRMWDPPRSADHGSLEATASRLDQERIAFGAGLSWRYWISALGSDEVIGQCQVSGVQRGPFQSASLGYGLDAAVVGQGLMAEALGAVICQVFAPGVWLHRLQAAVRPENARSLKLLQRLGFTREGRAPSYLFIDGAWRDHEILGFVNGDWPPEQAP